ncbi:phospholipase D family protein [Limoniibacter endophyticus]|uniref:Phospholipase D n=1 Tax=Limoniibacter endophyticus TaxID=1565040 RepID=A0A8J3DKR7_9HYPH|nr:phospholipase D family protein [Limoniibacter endophyticus]GHC77917.1 phospholipase D family protein [Limoniibacter endophyticus]
MTDDAIWIALFIIIALIGLGAFFIYSYGRFARHAQGECSKALPVEDGKTDLDRLFTRLKPDTAMSTGIMLVDDNLDAFAARVLSARHAGRSLDLIYYFWNDDLTGRLLANEVLKAADRGVRVRILLDDINTRDRDPFYLTLDSHPNIEVRLFNPTRSRGAPWKRGLEMIFRLVSVNRRMHNKAWIADGRVAFVGGRNIGDAYFDAAATNFRDLDAILMGEAVGQTEEMFDLYFNCNASVPIAALNRLRRAKLAKMRRRLAKLERSEKARPYLKRVRHRASVSEVIASRKFVWTERAQILSDPPGKAEGKDRTNWLMSELSKEIDKATSSLDLISPYFIPGERGCSWLADLTDRGVEVTVLTNSLAATDVVAVHGAYSRYRVRVLQAGVKLYELQPFARRPGVSVFGSKGASLHTKAFSVDGKQGFIGSFNFDPRSVSLNTEMGVLFHSDAVVKQMNAIFRAETRSDASFAVIWKMDRLLWTGRVGSRERVYRREPEAGVGRQILAKIIGWLPMESQL